MKPNSRTSFNFDKLSDIAAVGGNISILLMALIIVAEVVARNLFKFSFLYIEEISGYLMVCTIFLGLAITMKEGRHIRVDLIIDKLSARKKKWLNISACSLGLFFAMTFFIGSLWFVKESYETHAEAITLLHTPFFIPQLLIPIGLFFLIVQLIIEAQRNLFE